MKIICSFDYCLKNILFVGLIFCLIPFYGLAFFNYPAGFDDYQNVVNVFKYGEWGFVEYVYNTRAGRFSSNAFLAFMNPLKSKEWLIGFKIFPIILFTTLMLSITFVIQALGKGILNAKQIIFSSIGFLVLFLFAIPSVSELFYWFTAACVYTAGLIFFMLLLGSVIHFINADNYLSKLFYAFVILVSLVGAIGCNEPLLLAVLFLSFIALVWSFLLKSPHRAFFLVLFILACVISVFSIIAPGNTARGAALHGGESMFSVSKVGIAILKSIYFSFLKFISWTNSLVLLLVTISVIPVGLRLLDKNWWLQRILTVHPFWSLSLTVIFLAVQVFTAILGTGDADPRIWSVVYFFFLAAWFYNVLVFSLFFKRHIENLPFNFLPWLNPLILILLLFSSDGSINRAAFDLMVRAPQYKKSLENRYALIQSSSQQDLIVPPLFTRKYKYPKTIFVKEISTNPSDGNNVSLSKYFGLKSVKLGREPVE